MRVQKIILANPQVFQFDVSTIHSEMDAIQRIASMSCPEDLHLDVTFKIRQTFLAIYNLLALGFKTLAIDLAIDLVEEAETSHNYKIALDLCDLLIIHYIQIDDPSSIRTYKLLYDKFAQIVSNEHETTLLYWEVIENYSKVAFQGEKEIDSLVNAFLLRKPYDPINAPYYFYRLKAVLLQGKELEDLYLKAIEYFTALFGKHDTFIAFFKQQLIQYYLNHNEFQKADSLLKTIESGSIFWFKTYLVYAKALLKKRDLYVNDICLLIMEHPNYRTLPTDLKEACKSVYKASIRLLLEH